MQNKKNIILGAGPTGLGVAYGLIKNKIQPKNIYIIEKNICCGGLAGSFKLNNNIIDYGPHRLAPTIKEVVKIARDSCKNDLLLKKSEHGVYIDNILYSFPSNIFEWLNFKSIFFISKFIFSLIITRIKFFFFTYKKNGFKEVLEEKFGSFFYKKIIDPMAKKVWGFSTELDSSFIHNRFSQLKISQLIINKIFPRKDLNPENFYYPKFGFQQLWDDMVKKNLKNTNIHLNSYPEKIFVNNDGYIDKIIFNKKSINIGKDINIISTIPVFNLLTCLKNFKKKEMLNLSKNINIRSMILFIFNFNQKQTLPLRTLIFPQNFIAFNRIYEQNRYSRFTVEKNKSIIVADITYNKNDNKFNKIDLVTFGKKELAKLKFIKIKNLIETKIKIIKYAYISPTKKSKRSFEKLESGLKRIKNLHLVGRFGSGEYDNSDYALMNGINLADFICKKTDIEKYKKIVELRKKNIIVG